MVVVLSYVIGFLAGIILGALATFFLLKRKIEQRLREKIRDASFRDMARLGAGLIRQKLNMR
jgi:uncharacterized protein YneF (UPF0154 family)